MVGTPAELVLPGATLVVGALVSWLAQSRRLSGKIGTSDASRLWAASETMRTEYREDLAAANRRVVALEERNNELVHEKIVLENRIAQLQTSVKGADDA